MDGGGKCIETWINVRSRSPYTQGAEEEEEEKNKQSATRLLLLLSSSKLYRTGCTASPSAAAHVRAVLGSPAKAASPGKPE